MAAITIERSAPDKTEQMPHLPVCVPPHIVETPWLEYQQLRARVLCDALSIELEGISSKPSAARVHDTRVTLRRWFSVWAVLKQDGWESRKIRSKVIKPLRQLLRALGSLRDWDVALELGQALGCPQTVLEEWSKEQRQARREVKAFISRIDTGALVMRLLNHLIKRYEKLRSSAISEPGSKLSTYEHLDLAVTQQETRVKELESTASTPAELHQLRLAIKRWRYLMTEFFGLTNLQLVKAQQLLGRLNDYQRLDMLLAAQSEQLPQLSANLKAESQRLLGELDCLRHSLPYGLRPKVLSLHPGRSGKLSRRQPK